MKFILLGWMIALMRRGVSSLVVGLVSIGLNTESALADGSMTLSGRWSATALTSKWVIGQWGDTCGPRPGGGGAPAGEVNVTQSGGELTISGAGRTYRTTSCWEEYPGARVVSHSGGGRSWKTTCKTPASDSRQVTITTSVTATDDTISFYEAGQYQLSTKGQICTASVGRYRNFKLIKRAGEAAPSAPSASASAGAGIGPNAKSQQQDRCMQPGPPSRLDVRPSRKLMRPGESFAFKALVFDAKGCQLRTPLKWSIARGADQADVSNGTVAIAADAPEGEVQVTASAGDRSAMATIEVASKARYEALLQGGGFDQSGAIDRPAPVANTATKSIGAKSAIAEDKGEGRKAVFIAIVGAVALALGVTGLVIVRRTRKAHKVQAARVRAEEARALAEAAAEPPPEPAVEVPAQNPPFTRKICPICGTQYPPDFKFCGSDGASLVPIN